MANYLQTRGQNAPAPAKQTSVFDDADSFQAAMKMATALSKTTLIPKQFQGKPEDCLIALEYSRRLDVAPTAIMPHLFVVYGTPSMSAQMMIALVNRSGRFTRIKWDEGKDGNVVFKGVGGKTVDMPNYWAQAKFTELATGEEITSARVDLRMALANGWLTKGEEKGAVSMWQKIPTTMLRYRSASMLIKTTCPELMMGMDSAEDVADYGGSGASATVETLQINDATPEDLPIRPAPNTLDDAIDQIVDKMTAAQTLEELNALASQVASADFDDERLQILRDAYAARKTQLEADNNAPARNDG